MEDLKKRTITDDNITLVNGYHYYINHIDKLATHGFKTKEKLIEYKDMIRFDNKTIILMQNRYNSFYPVLPADKRYYK
jgi:hypothetical protein